MCERSISQHSPSTTRLIVRRRFGAFLSVFAFFFCFLCPLRADIVYVDDEGNIISSEKTEIDRNGNIIVVPAEEVVEEIVTPSRVSEEEIANADGEHLDLKYAGISIVSVGGGADKTLFRLAPPNAVKLVIPEGVTEIDGDAFRQCKDLESVVIPNSVNLIPSNAFSYMVNRKLKSVVIPAHASIEYRAFYNLPSLESVTLNRDGEAAAPQQNASIGQDAFGWCLKLKQIEFPVGIRTIGKDAFMNCELLESITLPEGVETIGEGAFCQCFALKTLRLPDSVKTIGMWAFRNCHVLEDFKMPSGPIDIGDGAFGDCYALKHIKWPPILSSNLPDAFINCKGLESVELPNGITSIDLAAFDNCPELKEIRIPEGVKEIAADAFQGVPCEESVCRQMAFRRARATEAARPGER